MNQSNENIKLLGVMGRLLVLFVMLCGFIPSFSQTASYFCDFEDPNENSKWQLLVGSYAEDGTLVNKWVIDTAINNGGLRSLYISNDGGKTAAYEENQSGVIVTSRTLQLPVGEYEISFDWMEGNNVENALHVCWIPHNPGVDANADGKPDTTNIFSSFYDSPQLPPWLVSNVLWFGDTTALANSPWTAASNIVEVKPGIAEYKLVFVWIGSKADVDRGPGACVDNINILPLGACNKPYDLNVVSDGNKVTFSWGGSADSYDIRYRSISSDEWVTHSGLTDGSITVDGSGEGMYELFVRSNCGDLHSGWVSISKFVFYKGTRCIDYLDLSDQNCWIGNFANPTQMRGAVDFGYSSRNSRHTIHSDKNEVDPRTGHSLKTVPPDEIASVRLGNWSWGSEGEAVRFNYHVDASTSAILLLKYAVVLENPNHNREQQPHFALSVNKNGATLGRYDCGEADFYAGDGLAGWNTTPVPGDPSTSIQWKDWTTIGINLAEYDGEDLTVELTTYDCLPGQHYGYAYFTLGCSDGRLTSLSCGEDPVNVFKAPDGFNYQWYKKSNPGTILERGQEFSIPSNDTAVYVCKVMQPTEPNCFFSLEAVAMKRWPVAKASHQSKIEDCSNIVDFTNESYVEIIDQVKNDTLVSDERPETVYWDFGDGSPISQEWNPSHIFPSEGGTFTVKLTTGLAGDKCTNFTDFTVTVPNIVLTPDTVYEYTCYGVPFTWDENGEVYEDAGTYSDTIVDPTTGCDQITVLVLTMRDEMHGELNDTVCTDDLPYIFNGKEYTTTGAYIDTITGPHGCDSVITINLLVNTSLNLNFDTEIQACADDDVVYIPYDVESGLVTSYDVIFSDDAASGMGVENAVPSESRIELAIPDDIRPDNYKAQIVFANSDCGDVVRDVNFHILYPDSIVVQRWNDVLGVRNEGYNGGYDFTSFQWYKDGDVLVGQTSSNLYVSEGLDVNAQYTVLVTRGDDGHSVLTCPKTPNVIDVPGVPTIVFNSNDVYVKSDVECVMRIWSVTGVLVGIYEISSGDITLPAPRPAGVYIIEMETKNGDRMIEKIITGY